MRVKIKRMGGGYANDLGVLDGIGHRPPLLALTPFTVAFWNLERKPATLADALDEPIQLRQS